MGYGVYPSWEHMMGYGLFSPSFLVLSALVVFVVVIGYVVSRGQESKLDKAMDILKERYVRGEISKEEFEEKKQVIQK